VPGIALGGNGCGVDLGGSRQSAGRRW
jgi:hypothetical protein